VSNQHRMEQLSDQQLRQESSRRRLLYIVISVATTALMLVAQVVIRTFSAEGPSPGIAFVLVLSNLLIVYYLFRWMSVPAKERARRRRLSVLKMLGVEDQPKPTNSAAD